MLCTIVAVTLTIIGFFSICDSAVLISRLIVPPGVPVSLTSVINALQLTITVIVLFKTVTVYFRTKHAEVRALLVAGLTGRVRDVLVYNRQGVDPMTLSATVSLPAVLIAEIVLFKPGSFG